MGTQMPVLLREGPEIELILPQVRRTTTSDAQQDLHLASSHTPASEAGTLVEGGGESGGGAEESESAGLLKGFVSSSGRAIFSGIASGWKSGGRAAAGAGGAVPDADSEERDGGGGGGGGGEDLHDSASLLRAPPWRGDEFRIGFKPRVPSRNSHSSHNGGGAATSPGGLGFGLASPHAEYASGTISSGVFNLSTTVIGAGIMGLPATLRVLGLPLGVVLLVLMAVLTGVSLEYLVKSSTVLQCWSYGEMVGLQCGPGARLVLDLSVLVNNLGMCIVYLIIVADVMAGTARSPTARLPPHEGLLDEWGVGDEWWASRPAVILIVMLVFLVPLASFRHVDSLHYSSAVSVALALVFVAICTCMAIGVWVSGKLQAPGWLPSAGAGPRGWLDFFSVIPVMATAYTCHYSVHPIYYELKNRSEARMFSVMRISLVLCTVIYLFTSVSSFLLFGSATASDVLINFDTDLGFAHGAVINDIVRVSYVLHIILVFPVIFYSLRNTSDDIMFPHATLHITDDGWRFWCNTGVNLVIVYVGAVVVPNIWVAFEVTGATATMSLSFFFPALLALRDISGVISVNEKRMARAMIVFAVVVSVTGVLSSVHNVIAWSV